MQNRRKVYWKVFISFFIGLNFLNWWHDRTTSFLGFLSILALLFILARGLLDFLCKKKVINSDLFQKLNILLFATLIALLVSEIFLRCFVYDLRSYGERNGGADYSSSYRIILQKCDSCNGGFFFVGEPNGIKELNKPEFHYQHKYNSLGLRDREFITTKDTGEFRIIGLGDSFVEGVGTSGDSTWLKQLEYRLKSDSGNLKYTTMNAGIQGSDLFFTYDLFTHCLLKYRPNLVILNLNTTDVSDIIYRGAYERYDARGNFQQNKGPWWEFFFGASYMVRLVALHLFQYSWYLYSPARQQLETDNALASISKKLNDYQTLAQKEHFDFLLILQPLQNELVDTNSLLSKIKVGPAIRKINLTEILVDSIIAQQGNTPLFYFPVDGHFTTRGYGVEAQTIYQQYFDGDKH